MFHLHKILLVVGIGFLENGLCGDEIDLDDNEFAGLMRRASEPDVLAEDQTTLALHLDVSAHAATCESVQLLTASVQSTKGRDLHLDVGAHAEMCETLELKTASFKQKRTDEQNQNRMVEGELDTESVKSAHSRTDEQSESYNSQADDLAKRHYFQRGNRMLGDTGLQQVSVCGVDAGLHQVSHTDSVLESDEQSVHSNDFEHDEEFEDDQKLPGYIESPTVTSPRKSITADLSTKSESATHAAILKSKFKHSKSTADVPTVTKSKFGEVENAIMGKSPLKQLRMMTAQLGADLDTSKEGHISCVCSVEQSTQWQKRELRAESYESDMLKKGLQKDRSESFASEFSEDDYAIPPRHQIMDASEIGLRQKSNSMGNMNDKHEEEESTQSVLEGIPYDDISIMFHCTTDKSSPMYRISEVTKTLLYDEMNRRLKDITAQRFSQPRHYRKMSKDDF